jgi:hypothetical protein
MTWKIIVSSSVILTRIAGISGTRPQLADRGLIRTVIMVVILVGLIGILYLLLRTQEPSDIRQYLKQTESGQAHTHGTAGCPIAEIQENVGENTNPRF